MEIRTRKLSITKVGGNASTNSKRASIGLPMPWLEQMGLDENTRDIKMIFDGDKIIIEKSEIQE